jgi:hypothetical protein
MFQHSASNRVTHRIQPLEHRAEATVRAVDFSIAWPRKQSSKCMARMSCLRHMDMNPEVSWSIWQKNCHTHRLQCGEKLFCSMCRLLLCICMSWSFSQLFVIWNSEARPATECHLSTSIPKVTLSFFCERISFWNKHPGTFRLDFQLLCLRVIRNTANAEDGPLYVHEPCSSRFYIDCAACCMASISDLKISWDPRVNLQTVGVLFNSFGIRCLPSWGRLIVRMNNLCIFPRQADLWICLATCSMGWWECNAILHMFPVSWSIYVSQISNFTDGLITPEIEETWRK